MWTFQKHKKKPFLWYCLYFISLLINQFNACYHFLLKFLQRQETFILQNLKNILNCILYIFYIRDILFYVIVIYISPLFQMNLIAPVFNEFKTFYLLFHADNSTSKSLFSVCKSLFSVCKSLFCVCKSLFFVCKSLFCVCQ